MNQNEEKPKFDSKFIEFLAYPAKFILSLPEKYDNYAYWREPQIYREILKKDPKDMSFLEKAYLENVKKTDKFELFCAILAIPTAFLAFKVWEQGLKKHIAWKNKSTYACFWGFKRISINFTRMMMKLLDPMNKGLSLLSISLGMAFIITTEFERYKTQRPLAKRLQISRK